VKAKPGRWREALPGMYVQDKDGKAWKIQSMTGVSAKLVDSSGQSVRVDINLHAKVTFLSVTRKEAVKLVASKLGGVIISEEKQDG
jgi:hypothetical protein